jgi:GDP-4-dehydro-6-deoxy-D-mannose reductase
VARQAPSARIVLISSAEVYGNQAVPLSEESEIDIRSPYGLSKYAMEILGELHRKGRGLDILRVRSFNFTGPGQASGFVIPDFASQIARIEIGNQEAVLRVGELSVRRDFSDVRDIARYLEILGKKGKPGKPYNLCSGSAYSIQELLDSLLAISGRDIRIVRDEKLIRPVDIPVLQGSNRRMRDELGLSPRYSLTDTLRDTLEYWRQRVQ